MYSYKRIYLDHFGPEPGKSHYWGGGAYAAILAFGVRRVFIFKVTGVLPLMGLFGVESLCHMDASLCNCNNKLLKWSRIQATISPCIEDRLTKIVR